MAKHLNATDIQTILGVINSWKGSALTWEGICSAVAPFVGKRPTRQSLNSNDLVKLAYLERKKFLGKEVAKPPSPSSMSVAQARIERLEAELKLIAVRNQQLLERFVVWQYNATKYGLSFHQLNEPLPRIDRERSVPKSVVKKQG